MYRSFLGLQRNKKILDSKEAEGGTFFQSFYVGLSAPAGCLKPRAHFSRLQTCENMTFGTHAPTIIFSHFEFAGLV